MNETQVLPDGSIAITLTRGKKAIIDAQDLEMVSQYRWSATRNRSSGQWYAATGKTQTKPHMYMHRLIIGAKPGEKVDHKNRDGLNNRRTNIRIATASQNGRNRIMPRGISGYRGVHWFRPQRKWRVMVKNEGKDIYGGMFTDVVEAAKAYDEIAKSIDGDNAVLNFPV